MRARLLVAALGLALLLLPGCGGGGTSAEGAEPDGAEVFAKADCGSCHTLAAAGATGTTGPSLDGRNLDADTIERQVRSGGNGMPAFDGTLGDDEIAAVSDYVAESAAEPTSGAAGAATPSGFEPDGATLASCRKDAADFCFRRAFGNLATADGPAAALDRFQQEIATEPAIEADCHPIAHTIGAAALRYFDGDIGKAFAAGNAACGSGYYHGLLEWKLVGLPEDELPGVARSVCSESEIRANAFTYYQCIHGLGHGLMLYTRYELPDALDLCHGLETSYDQVSCSGGVFMENQQSSYGLKSKWLRDDDLLYPCGIVEQADKLYCYLLVTSQILPRVGYDWKQAADWCRRSEEGFVGICFQSYGRDASGVARQEPAKIREFCAQAGDGERECVFGAVRDILNNNATDLRGRGLCEAVAAANRSYCFYGIGSILGTVHGTEAARAAACTTFAAPRDRADCVGGAASAGPPTTAP